MKRIPQYRNAWRNNLLYVAEKLQDDDITVSEMKQVLIVLAMVLERLMDFWRRRR